MSREGTGRARLSRNSVLAAALRIADDRGLAALSLRELAAELGVTPMSLYRYVGGKDDLLDGIADRILGEVQLPDDASEWQDRLREIARSVRVAVLRHPSAVSLMGVRPLLGPNALRLAETLLGVFRQAGVDYERAVVLYDLFARFTFSMLRVESALGRGETEEGRAAASRAVRIQLETLPAKDFPHLIEAARYIASPIDPENVFETGLDITVAGIELQVRRG